MQPYSLNLNSQDIQVVGKLDVVKIKSLTGVDFPTDLVQMYPGAIRHVQRNHPGIIEQYGHLIPSMIANPDYVGQNPKEGNSVELVKVIGPHLLLAIKLDPSGYIFLSTFFELDNGVHKVQKRLKSGRLAPFN
ncbi:PBECR3 domain-containing polyvalent protein [Paenibacillus sp. FSL R7-0026]|uniref:PBECR3 domain-containing polyvalent protein n=1 Tax=Paenibacillus sp. FSL R7-0026 TaxID=2921668 RepID=UPI0030F95A0C